MVSNPNDCALLYQCCHVLGRNMPGLAGTQLNGQAAGVQCKQSPQDQSQGRFVVGDRGGGGRAYSKCHRAGRLHVTNDQSSVCPGGDLVKLASGGVRPLWSSQFCAGVIANLSKVNQLGVVHLLQSVGPVGDAWVRWGTRGFGGGRVGPVGDAWVRWGTRGSGGGRVGPVGDAWVRWGTRGSGGGRVGPVGDAWVRWGTRGSGGGRVGPVGDAWVRWGARGSGGGRVGPVGGAWVRWGTRGSGGGRVGPVGDAWVRWGTRGSGGGRVGPVGDAWVRWGTPPPLRTAPHPPKDNHIDAGLASSSHHVGLIRQHT